MEVTLVKGFTLIELMMTVAIVAILAAVAYPSYVEHVYRSRRADAKATLTELAQWMERNYMLSLKYDKNSQGNNIDNTSLQTPIQGRTVLNYYDFAFVNNTLTATAFTLSATAKGSQAGDSKCKVLTLTSTGLKSAYDANAQADANGDCWK
ncbi:MAG: type IV pilin protein [Candidatus Competibacteraceae bacterium]